MTEATSETPNAQSTAESATNVPASPAAEAAVGRIADLLSGLIQDQQIPSGERPRAAVSKSGNELFANQRFENELAMVRLGVATSLFYAIRVKHPPTATHSLRVAIACSAWSERLRLDDTARDRIEVAALLHDIGKIGIPDNILKKPARLSVEEQATMDLCPMLGAQILRGCTDDRDLLDIIRYTRHWYRSRREDEEIQGERLPLGSRMLAIVEAFDAMTTDHVYRPAMSRERALAELTRFAGSQFDPDLARDFHRMLEERPEVIHGGVINRWLKDLRQTGSADTRWCSSPTLASEATTAIANPTDGFFRQLMTHTNDGVAFIDRDGVVREWNTALFELTGVSADAVCGNQWDSRGIRLCDRRGEPIEPNACPILHGLKHGSHSSHQLAINTARGLQMINLRVSSVANASTGISGVVAIFQDASQQVSLERRVQDLNERVTRDPLTNVANRAEFDRCLAELSDQARDKKIIFSLIIADIDNFKSINDTYGHQAGDEAIVTFARILSEHSREGDLVARYGGEEFVLLCPNCDNAVAAKRAEAIRQTLEQTTMSFLENRAITASFGVTEYQGGDSADSVLARADRALLRAKDNGRNRVIQLGVGGFHTETEMKMPAKKGGIFSWFDWSSDAKEQSFRLTTPVPIDLVIEKLRGFVADHHAEILHVGPNSVEVRISTLVRIEGRRRSDRKMDFQATLVIDEAPVFGRFAESSQTILDVTLKVLRSRDRRDQDIKQGHIQVLSSLRSYLMAEIVDQP